MNNRMNLSIITAFVLSLLASMPAAAQTIYDGLQDQQGPIGPIVYSWRPLHDDDDADHDDDDDKDDDKKNKITPQMTVRGEAELNKPADQLRMSIGVISEDPDAQKALDDNSKAMEKVVDALNKAGLDKGEYQTGRFRVSPMYSRRPPRAEEDWRPQITGYQVTNTIDVKTKKLDLAGKLIQAANKAGANTINGITFDMADNRTHRAEAIREATKNARDDAKVLTEAAGVRIVRVLSVRLDDASPIVDYRSQMRMGGDMALSAPSPSITPGDVTIRASVTIIYEIKGGGNDEAAAAEDETMGFRAELPF